MEGFRVSIEKGGCEIVNLFKAGCRAAFVFTEECGICHQRTTDHKHLRITESLREIYHVGRRNHVAVYTQRKWNLIKMLKERLFSDLSFVLICLQTHMDNQKRKGILLI